MNQLINWGLIQIDDVALESIAPRCSNLQHLNISWTGGGGQVTESAFCRYFACAATIHFLTSVSIWNMHIFIWAVLSETVVNSWLP